MNWITFAIATYVLLSAAAGLAPAWMVWGVVPQLLLILGVFVGVSAHRAAVLWSMLLLGLLVDLQPGPLSAQGLIPGPSALGYLLGGYLILQLRQMLFRDSVLTLVLLVLVVGGFAAVLEALLYAFRGLPWLAGEPSPLGAGSLLWFRAKEIGYTAAVAVPLGLVLQLSRRLWGFSVRSRSEKIF